MLGRRPRHWSAGRRFELNTRHGDERRFLIMTRTRLAGSVATAALIVAAVTSCASDGPAPVPSPTTSAAPTLTSPAPPTTSTATATPPTDSEIAANAASAVLREFYDVRSQLRQDSSRSLTLLEDVAISTELTAQRNLFEREREQGLRQIGETKIVELEVTSVNLDNSDPSAGKVPTVQIELCFDVSGVDVVDQDGKSAISPDRPDTGWIQFQVANYEWDTNPEDAWRVASSQDIERTPCATS
ncbi:hypothetical protein GA707_14845 [Nostocoides sp. F2B08]|uniref:hypothetical protein n=1 Tax=Nostocoides sp. F2B08 TaxID=2653936 RepID=UPI001263B7FC|nr:hypothetical protein [Tetrasphaera sp. F2B08]KAB7742937.1 hypothetical protein GA707_14845 [Tetrasphaera sp. F2B08]